MVIRAGARAARRMVGRPTVLNDVLDYLLIRQGSGGLSERRARKKSNKQG